jgi:hypothetical protein
MPTFASNARLESVRLSWHVGQVANLPKFWQVANLPHIGTCGVDVTPYCITLRKADGLFTGVLNVRLTPRASRRPVNGSLLHTSCLDRNGEDVPRRPFSLAQAFTPAERKIMIDIPFSFSPL